MALADFAGGVQLGLQELLAQRVMEAQAAEKRRQQQFENQRMLQADARAQQQLDATLAGNDLMRGETKRMNDATIANQVELRNQGAQKIAQDSRETWRPNQILGAQNPALAQFEKAGVQTGISIPQIAPRLYTAPIGSASEAKPTGERAGVFLTETPSQQKTRVDDQRAAAKDAADETYRRDSLALQRDTLNATTATRNAAEAGKQKAAEEQDAKDAQNAQAAIDQALEQARALKNHRGFRSAYGIVNSRIAGVDPYAVNAGALADQLVATLTLPNLSKLKGPASDKDVAFIKSASTILGNRRISAEQAAQALDDTIKRLEAYSKPTPPPPMASHGGKPTAAELIEKYTRPQR